MTERPAINRASEDYSFHEKAGVVKRKFGRTEPAIPSGKQNSVAPRPPVQAFSALAPLGLDGTRPRCAKW
jgi:hypothetical protein